jgi:hypothetical protein
MYTSSRGIGSHVYTGLLVFWWQAYDDPIGEVASIAYSRTMAGAKGSSQEVA